METKLVIHCVFEVNAKTLLLLGAVYELQNLRIVLFQHSIKL